MFEDREDAGQKLAKALEKYKDKKVLVLAMIFSCGRSSLQKLV